MAREPTFSTPQGGEDDDEHAPGLTFKVRVVQVRRGEMRVVTIARGNTITAIVKVPTKR
jgi:hypothetical protein